MKTQTVYVLADGSQFHDQAKAQSVALDGAVVALRDLLESAGVEHAYTIAKRVIDATVPGGKTKPDVAEMNLELLRLVWQRRLDAELEDEE